MEKKKRFKLFENFLLKFPKLSNKLFKYSINNKLGKFLKDFQSKDKIDCVYDVGAHKGEWADFYKDTSLKKSRFILFEANKFHSKILEKKKYEYFNIILSDKQKIVNFFNNDNSTGDSYYRENTFLHDNLKPVKLGTSTLDDVVKKNTLPKPDLIKIDTQGSELDILKGSTETIKDCKLIYLECPIANYNQNNLNFNDYLEYMIKINFVPQEICQIHRFYGYLVQVDILFMKKDLYRKLNFNEQILSKLF